MTSLNATQAGLEVWGAVTSKQVVTQAALEFWGATPSSEVVTQVGLETWSTPDTVSLQQVTQAGLEVWSSAGQLVFGTSALWQTDVMPSSQSTYVEGNSTMIWEYQTVLLPDNQAMKENLVIQANLEMAFIGAGPVVEITVLDTDGDTIQALDVVPGGTDTIWGEFIWGEANWGGTKQNISPYQLNWTETLQFKQASFFATGELTVGFRIGNLYMNFQVLGYQQQTPSGVS